MDIIEAVVDRTPGSDEEYEFMLAQFQKNHLLKKKAGPKTSRKRTTKSEVQRKRNAKAADVHEYAEDEIYAGKPVIGNMSLFVCTYKCFIEGIDMGFEELTKILQPRGNIVAINSNFGHKSLPGYEHRIKTPSVVVKPTDVKKKTRRRQGDGTCFNSAVELVVILPHVRNIPAGKTYIVKCFSTTGQVQIPGVLLPDFTDGIAVINEIIPFINEQLGTQAKVSTHSTSMLNYKYIIDLDKFRREKSDNPELYKTTIRLQRLSEIIGAHANDPAGRFIITGITTGGSLDTIFSCQFKTPTRAIRLKLFQSGKVNILGSDSQESAIMIYLFMTNIFLTYWEQLICEKKTALSLKLKYTKEAFIKRGLPLRRAERYALVLY